MRNINNRRIAAWIAAVVAAAALASPSHASAPDVEAALQTEANVDALARMLWGECRGVESDTEKAACCWVVLNRVDDRRWPDTVLGVLEQPLQFAGYDAGYPVDDGLRKIAADVYQRWQGENDGFDEVGRVIPMEYYYWYGKNGHNHFYREWDDRALWSWDWCSPYED